MAKVFEVNFNKGSIVEYAGTTLTRTGITSLKKTQKGWALQGSNSDYFALPASNPTNSLTTGTIECWVKFNDNSGTSYNMIISDNASGLEVTRNISTNKLEVYLSNSALTSTSTVVFGKWYHIVCTWSVALNTRTLYINGVAEATNTCSAGATAATRYIGARAGAYGANGEIAKIMVDNTYFTSAQVMKLYDTFLNASYVDDPKRGFLVNKPTDLSKEVNKTLGSNLPITSWLTQTGVDEYETFTLSGANIISAINTTGNARAITNTGFIGTVVAGDKYKVIYKLTLNSGTAPTLNIRNVAGANFGGTQYSTELLLSNGINNADFTITVGGASAGLFLYNSSATNYSLEILSVTKFSGLVAAYNMRPNGLTLTDISGNGYNGTISGTTVSTKDGLLTNGVNGLVTTAMTITGGTPISYQVAFIPKAFVAGGGLLGAGGTGGSIKGFSIIQTSTSSTDSTIKIYISDGSTSVNTATTGKLYANQLNTLSVSWNGVANSNITITINGVSEIVQVNKAWTGASEVFKFGSVVGGNYVNCEYIDLKVLNRVLTTQEIKDYHNSFAKQPYLVEDFSDAPADGTSIVPRQWQKISGTFKAGEISLAQGNLIPNGYFESGITGVGITTGTGGNATLSYGTASPITGVGSLRITQTTQPSEAFRPHISIPLTKTTEIDKTYSVRFKSRLLSGAVKFSAGNGVQLGLPSSQAYLVDQVFSGTQQWSVTVKSTAVGTNMFLYFNGSLSAFDLLLDDIEVVEIPPLPTLTKGSKYLECVTAGLLVTPNQQAYGTYELDFYKRNDAGEIQYVLFADRPGIYGTANGYSMVLRPTEAIRLYSITTSGGTQLTGTADNYFTINTWYRLRITRTTAGAFTMLIKGGNLAPTAGYNGWHLLTMGSGNPYTSTTYTSGNYFGLSLNAGDRIANIKLTNGIII